MDLRVHLIERGPLPEQTREIPITQEEFLIGRATDCDLRLRMTDVSRHHCIIRVRPDDVTLIDLGSSNGTFVNGQRIRSQAALHSGDEVRLGNATFVVDLGDRETVELKLDEVDPLARTQVVREKGKQG